MEIVCVRAASGQLLWLNFKFGQVTPCVTSGKFSVNSLFCTVNVEENGNAETATICKLQDMIKVQFFWR